MIYFIMRASCMAGALPPRRAFCGTLELVVGFLSCVGAAGGGAGAGELTAARMLLRGDATEGEGGRASASDSSPGGKYLFHGGACAPALEPRMRELVRAVEADEIARDEATRLRPRVMAELV